MKAILTGQEQLRKSNRKRIAIIGAGMSGLVAGWLLKRAGHSVTIFEAKHTVGGRVKTLRERFTSGFYAEAGAMRIPDHHGLTMWLIQSLFNLPTLNFFNHSPNGLIYINNQRMTYSQYEENPGLCKFSLKITKRTEPRTSYLTYVYKIMSGSIFRICQPLKLRCF